MSLNNKQVRAIDVLLTSRTYAIAAKRSKVDIRTLYRWLNDPEFKAELASAQRLAINQNIRGVASMAKTAIKTLKELMAPGIDPRTRFDAAQEALERLIDVDLIMRADENSK